MAASEGWHGWDAVREVLRLGERADRGPARRASSGRATRAGTADACWSSASGTGRVTVPLARAGIPIVGIDRSANMLAYARQRLRRRAGAPGGARSAATSATLPFAGRRVRRRPRPVRHPAVAAARQGPRRHAGRGRARACRRAGGWASTSCPTCRTGASTERRVSLTGRPGRTGPPVTLVESVRQDRSEAPDDLRPRVRRRLGPGATGRTVSRVTFRTLPVKTMARRLERAGFEVDAVLGGYDGRPWDERAETWIVLAGRRR